MACKRRARRSCTLAMMNNAHAHAELVAWLESEVSAVEALLQGCGPTCQLDRQHATPPSLKALEGRYYVLRRAKRLLKAGQPLQALVSETRQARTTLEPNSGLARQAAAEAYAQAVLDAVQALRERSGEAWAGKADHSDP